MSSPSSVSPPPARHALIVGIRRGEERHPLGDRPGAHEQLEQPLDLADPDAALLFGLAADRRLGVVAVEQPGGGFDQHPVGMSVEEDRQAELAGQQDGAGCRGRGGG